MKRWSLSGNPETLSAELAEPANLLAEGKLVAFPTETVYGLGANACNEEAVRGIFRAKGRPSDNPLIVHIATRAQLTDVVEDAEALPKPVLRLMDAFWPGPLTLILPANASIAPSVRPGVETVGVRMPSHPLALKLIELAGCPVAAPSANLSGKPSPTTADSVAADLEGRIAGIIDGGPCTVGLESTVVAVGEAEGVVYRPGWITPDELAAIAGVPIRLDDHLKDANAAPKSPGMKYRHYAPDAAVTVWYGDDVHVQQAVARFAGERPNARTVYAAPADYPDIPAVYRWRPASGVSYVDALSQALYDLLRKADSLGATQVIVVGLEPEGRAMALMNRLQKASEGRVFRV